MQDIERYGLITLLFLIASVVAVFAWGRSPAESGGVFEGAEAQVATLDGELLESQRAAQAVRTNPDARPPSDVERAENLKAAREAQRIRDEQDAAKRRERERKRQEREAARAAQLAEQQAEQEAAAEAAAAQASQASGTQQIAQGAQVDRNQESGAKQGRSLTRDYVIADGDSYWKVAERELGKGHLASKIEELNPGVNPGKLKVGDTIVIPTAQGLAQADRLKASTAPKKAPAETTEAKVALASDAPAGTRFHTVRDGQSGWTIARELCGRGSRWPELAAANPGVDFDKLKVDQRLRVPADWKTSSNRSSQVAQSSTPRRSKVR